MEHQAKHHIKRLKHHKNSLYIIVFILLFFQIIALAAVSTQIYRIGSLQKLLVEDIKNLGDEIDLSREESRFGVNALTQEIAQQKKDIQGEIKLLKGSQTDFSLIIEDVIKGVASINTDVSGASGFIVSSDGYVVTNYHVIQDANVVEVNTYKGDTYSASIIGYDSNLDLALLKINGNFDSLELANSDEIKIGTRAAAIGNPLGLSFSVTEGIVSGVDRTGPNGLDVYIQTDVTLNRGNSGGPLINIEGKVIGMNNFKIGDAEALGFAIESNAIRDKINEIAQLGTIQLSV